MSTPHPDRILKLYERLENLEVPLCGLELAPGWGAVRGSQIASLLEELPQHAPQPPPVYSGELVKAETGRSLEIELLEKEPWRNWFDELLDIGSGLYAYLESQGLLRSATTIARVDEIPKSARPSPRLWYEHPQRTKTWPYRFHFNELHSANIEFGGRLFLWLAIASDPSSFGLLVDFRRELEFASFWVEWHEHPKDAKKPASDRRVVLLPSVDPLASLEPAVERILGLSDPSAVSDCQIDTSQDGPKPPDAFVLNGVLVRPLTSQVFEILSRVWRGPGHCVDESVLADLWTSSKASDQGREHDVSKWLRGRLSKINKLIKKTGYRLEKDGRLVRLIRDS